MHASCHLHEPSGHSRWTCFLSLFFFSFFINVDGCPDQLACTSTNLTGPEVNDHISF